MQAPFGKQLVQGDTWDWLVTLCDTPASSYTLKLFFRGPQTMEIDATAEGDDFRLHKDPVDTSKLTPGTYRWAAAVFETANNNARTTVGDGTVEVCVDVASLKTFDGRTHAKKMLDLIDVLLLDRVAGSRLADTYQNDGRMVKYMSPEQLRKERGYWQSVYNQELIEAGELAPDFNQVQVGF